MAAEYCTVSDLYTYGLPRGGLPNPARLIDEVSAADNTFALDEHGFNDGDEITFRADSVDGAMPGGITENAGYFAIRVSDCLFQASATSGGVAVDLSSAGNRVLVSERIPYEGAIQWASEIINDMIPAHLVPLVVTSTPEVLKMTVAELAVGKLMSRQGAVQSSISTMVDAAHKRVERWAKGVPFRGAEQPKRANLAVSATAGYRDSRGWRSDDTI